MMYEAGWQNTDGTRIEDWQARRAAAGTHLALIRLGALVQDWHKLSDPEHPTQDGVKFARAALRTWPA